MANIELDDRVMSEETEETIKRRLFKLCMKGEWGKVVDTYESDKMAHMARITSTGDTALHLAVTDGQNYVVQQLVKVLMCEEGQRKESLMIQNDRGNTALHFAASGGSVEMCECIAYAEPSLLRMRNVDGETPIFLAALHGRKEAFLCLHYRSDYTNQMHFNYDSNCTRNDGDTILHSAIAGDFFDLAFQIIHLYGNLVDRENVSGFTPLHLLANKPSVFRSGNRLGRFEAMIYYAITVKELEVAPSYQQQCPTTGKEKNSYPKNYQTCMGFLRLIKIFTLFVTKLFTQFLYIKQQQDQIGTERDLEASTKIATNNGAETNSPGSETSDRSSPLFPVNYQSCVDLYKFIFIKIMLTFFATEPTIRNIQEIKEKNVWSGQIMDELLKRASMYECDDKGSKPLQNWGEHQDQTNPYSFNEGDNALDDIIEKQHSYTTQGDDEKMETPVLIAAKNGVTEMVEKILEVYPIAVDDLDAKKKNIVLLAIENRQIYLYESLLRNKSLRESTFRKVDSEGNTALHLAAKLGNYKPWLISGDALQMHCELKWYLFVRDSMPSHFFRYKYNNENKTPRDIFIETHRDLVRAAGEWQKRTSECSSVVAALIATVAFSSSTNVPGGFQEDAGTPILENRPEFKTFAISSIVALCCSVASMVCFLSILTSRYQEHDFGKTLPWKLIFSLTLLYVAITSSIVSFCAGHFYVDQLGSLALPVYAILCLSMAIFALSQFPLYIDLIRATKKVPERDQETFLQ
ncbi:hypothetical protein AAZX31_15G084200 [Glycine max]|uniref:PGG domain-containing protein n=2 Tax=Glycine subgen. Soja TaxID=1462606 RepID=K7MAE1_SOYBN|nr:uncharacterized protein LOC100796981 isoform X1 [Glycine max]XP_028203621.1 uncharacterized protein LOC114387618 [Glycine soja]KAH1146276.1 hypothetical protein GYH30_041780 [Glycine max]KRH11078.1 hypothetical protein GLYMA_15G087500v4 [Glycine max]RZB63725.1 hypothetical protein D0Y65_040359 [Glycine soja]|eukprot:XP_006597495.1 uncharacterized protein LOC100796981 [Glycine max]